MMVTEIQATAQNPVQPTTRASGAEANTVSEERPAAVAGNERAQAVNEAPANQQIENKPADKETEAQLANNLARELQSLVQSLRRSILFNVDQDHGRVIIRVIDVETQETVREIPSEEIQAIQRHLDDVIDRLNVGSESNSGILFSSSA